MSVIVSSCGLNLRPSIMRAVGSVVCAGSASVTVFVSRPQSRQLIQDISSTGRIAVVFSEPISHLTVQLKGVNARIRLAEASDATALARYLASMETEIQQVGFDTSFTRAMLAHRLEDVVAITFEPSQAFDQTPGPKAGSAIGASATGNA